ncbi:ABC transporter ATP-binding protein [Consotaella aegiceratis]|uniref:ABC transporter ATP-binding protein n=1 Tax=Consotaella aegiceratis TaxID=3097961 RepID=UPI002F41EE68
MHEPRRLRLHIRRKHYVDADGNTVEVLDDVAFALPRNAFTCLIGPSGCGKTTTLRILMGLDEHYEGEIDAALRTARLGAAFQEPRLLPWRTLAQNVALATRGAAEPSDALVKAALADVGLGDLGDRYPGQISLGQQRRAALARAFAVQPEILYLDEPFVSLDEATAQRLRRLLVELWSSRQVTVLMVTHNVREAVQLADRIVLMTERPARVAAELLVPLDRAGRTPAAVDAFAAEMARRYPALVAL